MKHRAPIAVVILCFLIGAIFQCTSAKLPVGALSPSLSGGPSGSPASSSSSQPLDNR